MYDVALPLFFVAALASIVVLSLHKIEEGHLGVYYRAGALIPEISNPGIHMMIPVLTIYKPIQVKVQHITWVVPEILINYLPGNFTNRRAKERPLWNKRRSHDLLRSN